MLAGKTAIITGSTSGIGLAIAGSLAAKGANVILNSFSDRPEDRASAERLAQEHGVEAHYVQADMSRPEDCRGLVEAAVERFGAIDILVNNAGVQHVAPVEDFPAERWDAIIAINLSSAFHTTAAALPIMKKKGWGRIVNIASAHGLRASINKSAYVAAKHGVVGLTKVVALEAAGTGVTCNSVCPGFVLTQLVEKQIEDLMEQKGLDRDTVVRDLMLQKQPTRQFATAEQIGETVTFLCSDSAEQITGTSISVDGGWTAQ